MSKKLDQFTELAAQPANADLFLLELASSGAYRKIKWQNLVADGSITTAKLATGAVTTNQIGTAAVTAPKIDFGGAGTGVWWEEIGRVTLGVAGDSLSVSSLPARNHLLVLITALASGNVDGTLRFNGDSGSNYSYRLSDNGGADATSVSQTGVTVIGTASWNTMFRMEVLNLVAQEKQAIGQRITSGGAGAAAAPGKTELDIKWANTAAAISSITYTNAQSGDFAIGSEIIVLGHN